MDTSSDKQDRLHMRRRENGHEKEISREKLKLLL